MSTISCECSVGVVFSPSYSIKRPSAASAPSPSAKKLALPLPVAPRSFCHSASGSSCPSFVTHVDKYHPNVSISGRWSWNLGLISNRLAALTHTRHVSAGREHGAATQPMRGSPVGPTNVEPAEKKVFTSFISCVFSIVRTIVPISVSYCGGTAPTRSQSIKVHFWYPILLLIYINTDGVTRCPFNQARKSWVPFGNTPQSP